MARPTRWKTSYDRPTYSGPETSGGSSGARSQVSRETQEAAGQPLTAAGLIPVYFGLTDVATGLTASKLYRVWPHSTFVAKQTGILAPLRGAISAISVLTDANKTAGTLTVEAYVDDVASGASVSLADAASEAYQSFNEQSYAVLAGKVVDLRITTASLTPAASMDLEAVLWLSLGKDLASAQT